MLRLAGGQVESLVDELMPAEVRALAEDLAAVDRLQDRSSRPGADRRGPEAGSWSALARLGGHPRSRAAGGPTRPDQGRPGCPAGCPAVPYEAGIMPPMHGARDPGQPPGRIPQCLSLTSIGCPPLASRVAPATAAGAARISDVRPGHRSPSPSSSPFPALGYDRQRSRSWCWSARAAGSAPR